MSITNLSVLEKDLDRLITESKVLLYSMADDCGALDKKIREKHGDKMPNFKSSYETWYSESMQVIKQILPDRLNDFIHLYKNDKRKGIDYLTYTMSDYMIGIQMKNGLGEVTVGPSSGIPKFQQQMKILESAKQRFKSSLFDIRQIIQADLFDDELHSAVELLKQGFIRASGVIAGVVLEKHLGEICCNRNIKITKKNPTISDFNDLLKDTGAYDVPTWRFIQRLGDIRNLCGHNKDREPTKEEASELIDGVKKITKTIY
jgi:hypothetical protein